MNLKSRFWVSSGIKVAGHDFLEQLLIREYGAMFVAQNVTAPQTPVFCDKAETEAFQATLTTEKARIGDHEFVLQTAAMRDLQNAASEVERAGLAITPRSADSGHRTFGDTVALWNSRVEPALEHWLSAGRLNSETVAAIRLAEPREQIAQVLELEKSGIFFAKNLQKSIIYSVAPPGSSQHLALIAFDVAEYDDERVRTILAAHGWFQTVVSDLPHFTYLGGRESELTERGLKSVIADGRKFWVPDV